MTREFKVSKFRCYTISFITFLAALSCGILLFLYAGNPKKKHRYHFLWRYLFIFLISVLKIFTVRKSKKIYLKHNPARNYR